MNSGGPNGVNDYVRLFIANTTASGTALGQLLEGLAIKRKSPQITQKLASNVTTYQRRAPYREERGKHQQIMKKIKLLSLQLSKVAAVSKITRLFRVPDLSHMF